MKQTIRWIGIATAFLLVVGACGKASHSSATKAKTGSAASDTSTCTPAKVGGTLNYGLLAGGIGLILLIVIILVLMGWI